MGRALLAWLCLAGFTACGFQISAGGPGPGDGDADGGAGTDAAPGDGPATDGVVDAPPDVMPVAPMHLQTVGRAMAATSTITSPTIPALASGRVFVAAVFRDHAQLTSISGLGATWSRVRNPCGGEGKIVLEVWTATAPTTAGTVTITLPGSSSQTVIAVSTFAHTGSLGTIVERNSAPNGTSCGTEGWETTSYQTQLAPQTADGHIYLAVGKRSESHAPGGGFTERHEAVSGATNSAGIAIADRAAIPGSTPITGTFGASEEWALVAVELRP